MPASEELPAELTVDQGAKLLNVSQHHLLELITTGAIPSHRRGAHQIVARSDVLAHRDLVDEQARHALDAMAEEAEDAGLYG